MRAHMGLNAYEALNRTVNTESIFSLFTLTFRKEISSRIVEKTTTSKNTEDRISSNIENKDTEMNLQSKQWSSSFLKESTGNNICFM